MSVTCAGGGTGGTPEAPIAISSPVTVITSSTYTYSPSYSPATDTTTTYQSPSPSYSPAPTTTTTINVPASAPSPATSPIPTPAAAPTQTQVPAQAPAAPVQKSALNVVLRLIGPGMWPFEEARQTALVTALATAMAGTVQAADITVTSATQPATFRRLLLASEDASVPLFGTYDSGVEGHRRQLKQTGSSVAVTAADVAVQFSAGSQARVPAVQSSLQAAVVNNDLQVRACHLLLRFQHIAASPTMLRFGPVACGILS